MSQLSEIIDAIDRMNDRTCRSGPEPDEIRSLFRTYADLCGQLPFMDPDLIRRARNVLGRTQIIWASHKSPTYRSRIDPSWLNTPDTLELTAGRFLMTKQKLQDGWFTDFPGFENKTSGSTGEPFAYRIWDEIYEPVETHCHYKMILDEFRVTEPRVLYIMTPLPGVQYYTERWGDATVRYASCDQIKNKFSRLHAGHGSTQANCNTIAFDQDAYLAPRDFCDFVVNYVRQEKINVLLSLGAFFELFATYVGTRTTLPYLGDLVSNTNDVVNLDTLKFFKEMGIARNYCDHMRCWDGGVSFFTCEHGTYHLQDELAYAYTVDGMLVSTDFLSFPSPFVNYANGDHATIGDEYERCGCGRWYRDFRFDGRRSRLQHTAAGDVDGDVVVADLVKKHGVRSAVLIEGNLVVNDELSHEQKHAIVKDMSKLYLPVRFGGDVFAQSTQDGPSTCLSIQVHTGTQCFTDSTGNLAICYLDCGNCPSSSLSQNCPSSSTDCCSCVGHSAGDGNLNCSFICKTATYTCVTVVPF